MMLAATAPAASAPHSHMLFDLIMVAIVVGTVWGVVKIIKVVVDTWAEFAQIRRANNKATKKQRRTK